MKNTILFITLLILTDCNNSLNNHSKNKSDLGGIMNIKNQLNDTITTYKNHTQNFKSNYMPREVFTIPNLKELIITGMDCDYIERDDKGNDITKCWAIKEIPAEIKNLEQLEILQLNINAINSIPIELTELKKLRILDLTDNVALIEVENISKVKNLEELYLYGCNISKLPNDIEQLRKLRKLALTGNNLSNTELTRIKKALPNCEIIF